MKIRNQQFLKRPWLFTIYTIIGGALGMRAEKRTEQ